MRKTRVLLALLASAVAAPATAQPGRAVGARPAGPLSELDVLTGTAWSAQGDGFSTTLRYRWLMPGRMLEATNEVRSNDGRVIARYRGSYVWDAGRGEVVFWTAGESGEVHRGRAWWQDGVLWHEAEVSGGSIETYASALRPGDGRLEYFAAYGRSDATAELLRGEAIVYEPAAGAPAAGALAALSFMAGCWRGEFTRGGALEEIYTAPAPNLMLGLSRFTRDGHAVQYEFSRITADSGGVVLLPFPGGRQSEHGFRLTRSEDGSALFEAPEHDFPKRIRYSRAADGSLTARIDGGDDERVQQWRMVAVPCPES